MLPDDPNWQMTVLFLLALALLGFVMKLAVLLLPARGQIQRHAISWVLVSPDSVLRAKPATGVGPAVLRILMLSGVVAFSYWIYWPWVLGFQIRGIFLSYLAAPFLLLVGVWLVAIVNLLLLPGGYLLPPVHHRSWAARSVADFWGHRWNLWFRDWFRYAIFNRLRRHPIFALFLVFAASGLMHEWVINLPLYFLTGKARFGTMMIYFLIQPVGILGERRFLKNHPRLDRVFVWLVVLAPVPLVLNEGLLRVLHLWPE